MHRLVSSHVYWIPGTPLAVKLMKPASPSDDCGNVISNFILFSLQIFDQPKN